MKRLSKKPRRLTGVMTNISLRHTSKTYAVLIHLKASKSLSKGGFKNLLDAVQWRDAQRAALGLAPCAD